MIQDIQIDPEGLPEVRQFGQIINAVKRKFNNSDIDELQNPFSRLGLE